MERVEQLFEERYGVGACERLKAMFDQPCTTFASIAGHFGVTRERVRQWHLELCPYAPRGHARQRLCVLQRKKRDLLQQPLFRAFYRHARAHFAPGRFGLVAGREGFRARLVQLDGRVISIRRARIRSRTRVLTYALNACVAPVDFVYYVLDEESFLFLPREVVRRERAYRSDGASPLEPFRNDFLEAFRRAASAPALE